jgi:hypothetical protein
MEAGGGLDAQIYRELRADILQRRSIADDNATKLKAKKADSS